MFNFFKKKTLKNETEKGNPVNQAVKLSPVTVRMNEDDRLSYCISMINEGHDSYIVGVYSYLQSCDKEIVMKAAIAIAAYMQKLDVKSILRLNEGFRSHSHYDYSRAWNSLDLDKLAVTIDNPVIFSWILRLGTFDGNGYFREKCIRRLKADSASYIYLLLRLNDWVKEVRDAAREACSDLSGLSLADLINCLGAFEKLRRSGRKDITVFNRFDEMISKRICELEPEITRNLIRKYDPVTRRALYKILIDNRMLSKDEISSLLTNDRDVQCQMSLMSLFVKQYELSVEELDEFINHKSIMVQRKSIEQKYAMLGKTWDGLENKMLSPSANIRETVRYIFNKNGGFDSRSYYLERLDISDVKICILGIGETGKPEDKEILLKYLDDSRTGVVKNTLHALGMLCGDKLSDLFWKYLNDDRQTVVLQAYREISAHNIRYGAEKIYDLFMSTDSELIKKKLAYMLVREQYWDRIPYVLMLFNYDDVNIRNVIRLGSKWKSSYYPLSKQQALYIKEVLENEQYQIPDSVRRDVLFNLNIAEMK